MQEITISEMNFDVSGPPVISTKSVKEEDLEIISGTIFIDSRSG